MVSKQAPKVWYDKFSKVMLDFSFRFCLTYTTLFVKNSNAGIIILLLYFDDMIITESDKQGVYDIKFFFQNTL